MKPPQFFSCLASSIRDLEMSNMKPPQFFKVFLPHHSAQHLKIPFGFVQLMGGRTSGSVFLKGPSRNTWKVHLMQKEDGLFFDEGWPIFVRDHTLDIGEFLIFKYDRNSHFTVVIFDRSCCEKEAAFFAKCSQLDNNIIKQEEGDERANPFEVFEDSPKRTRVPIRKKKKGIRAKACKETNGRLEIDEQRAAKSFTTNHPYFVVRIKEYNVRGAVNFYVPLTFSKEHLLSYRSNDKMVLRNQSGESWVVKLLREGKGCRFRAGWSPFVRNNNIKEGDTCTFELVDKYEMRVHISSRSKTEL